jgi:hypothetical protein
MSFVLEAVPDGVDLVVEGEWSAAMREALLGGTADGVVLNYARGFVPQPLGFLAELPIRRLNVLARWVDDLEVVYSLAPTLVELRLQTHPSVRLELGRLPHLRTLAAEWSMCRGSLRDAPWLEDLSVPSYSEPDLTALGHLVDLVSLVMKERPRLHSLNGVEALPRLRQLGVHLALKLDDISALGRGASSALEVLKLPSCRKVADIGVVEACPDLGFFELSEGARIPSVRPLAGLSRLERLYLYGSTQVADGNLEPIASLPRLSDFRMMNRREYSPSVAEIQAIIAARG